MLGGRAPGFADLPRLSYAEMVIKETMRLYPSAWLIGREAIQDCEIGGHRIKAGSSLIMSQWLKHRDPRYFRDAASFMPERWRGEETKQLPKFVYFPFGGGPRVCIGNSFAMMEAVLVLATVSQKFRLTASPGYQIQPWPAITLYPKGGVSLKVESRTRASPEPQAYFFTNTSSPSCAVTLMWSPGLKSPASSFMASGSSSNSWIARLSGRAPNCGS